MTNSKSSSAYNVLWSKQAVNYLQRLDSTTKKRIVLHVDWLAEDPHSSTLDIKPLAGNPGIFRLRVGKYRIIFSIEEEIKLLSISSIMPRGDVYKRF